MYVKQLIHLGVDVLWKRSLGDDLRIFDFNGFPGSSNVSKEFTQNQLSSRYRTCDPDIFNISPKEGLTERHKDLIRSYVGDDHEVYIFDNTNSLQYANIFPKIKRYIFYVHGYYTDKQFLEKLQSMCDKRIVTIISPTHDKLNHLKKNIKIGNCVAKVIKPGIPLDLYPRRNEYDKRILMMCHHIDRRIKAYSELNPDLYTLLDNLFSVNYDIVDIYGYHLNVNHPFFRLYKEFTMSPEELSKYAVGLYPMPHVAPSLSLLETMAMGIPCVTHPREGFSEKNHGVSYFLAEKKEEYQKYLSILLHDNDLNKSMSEWSRRFVARNYSMKRWKRAIELSLG